MSAQDSSSFIFCRGSSMSLEEVTNPRRSPTATPQTGDAPIAATGIEPLQPNKFSDQEQVGGYRIVRKIGDGGMGVVYEAVETLLQRPVALKLIRPGFMSADMIRRFEYEATLLARLEHPGIARIYHAGIHSSGAGPQPFFAMELIDGKRLDDYIQQNDTRLTIRQRAEVFHRICEAVQHAHAKGVIHRDLKPSNILVCRDEQPKILDFGVARAIDSDIKATTLHTESGQLIGTLPYMSPEQASGKVNEVDSASDVYALGVIAYELFSGEMPYELEGKALHEAIGVICNAEPSRLSSINRSLHGDIETIIQKALEKDKTRRYPTAGDLAGDIKRYLDYEPITARPPGTWYQLSRFARRNKLLVGSTVAILVSLALGLAGTLTYAIRAADQRAQAVEAQRDGQVVLDFLTERMLSRATPESIPNKEVRDEIVRAMIVPAARAVGDLRDQPLVEATVRNVLGLTLRSLGHWDEALVHARTALDIRSRMLPVSDPRVIDSLNNCGLIYWSMGRLEDADAFYQRALQASEDVQRDDGDLIATILHNYGLNLFSRREFERAEPYQRRALELRRKSLGDSNRRTITSFDNCAMTLDLMQRYDEAEELHRKAIELATANLGDEDATTIICIASFANSLLAQQRYAEAEPLLARTMRLTARTFGEAHRETLTNMSLYSRCLIGLGRRDEGIELMRRVADIASEKLGERNHDAIIFRTQLGRLLTPGHPIEAATVLHRALQLRTEVSGEGAPETILVTNMYAQALENSGNAAQAESFYRRAMDRALASLGASHLETTRTAGIYADFLERTGRPEEARALRVKVKESSH